MNIYWINLQKSSERRQFMLEQFKTLNITNHVRITPTNDIPHISCMKSHFQAILTAYLDNCETAMIVEDDIILKHLQINIKLPEEWECLQLHAINPFLYEKLIETDHPNILLKGYFMSCAAYIINRKGMKKFLEKMADEHFNLTCSFENPLAKSEEFVYRYINTYTFLYPLLNTNEMGTNIENTVEYVNRNQKNSMLLEKLLRKPVPFEERVYELEYDRHFFYDDSEVKLFLMKVFQKKNKKIGVYLNSGFGNRLFQLFSAYGISKKNNIPLRIIGHCENFQHDSKNDYLDFFNKIAEELSIFPSTNKHKELSVWKITEKSDILLKEKGDYEYTDFSFDKNGETFVLDGFLQNEKYFLDYKDEIHSVLNFTSIQNDYIVIHVRLGDFLLHPRLFVDLNNYYQKAMFYISTKMKSPKFMIITDTKDYLKYYPVLRGIDVFDDPDEFNAMRLMINSKGIICSNSTFSWWGVWLNENTEKIVTIPGKWFSDNDKILDMEGAKIIQF